MTKLYEKDNIIKTIISNLMRKYILYIDESGQASLTDFRYSHFVLTGLMLNSSENSDISGYFNFIKRKYGLDKSENFHSFDLFENKKSPYYLSDKDARELSSNLRAFIDTTPLHYNITTLNKRKLRKYFKFKPESFRGSLERKHDKQIGYDILASKLFFWFAGELSNHNGIGEIVVESRTRLDVILLEAYLSCCEPTGFLERPNISSLAKKCKNKIASIRFEKKAGVCGGLELADLISYTTYQYLTKNLKKFEKRGLKEVWFAIKKNKTLPRRSVIKEVKNNEFKKYLTTSRVNRISKIATSLNKKKI